VHETTKKTKKRTELGLWKDPESRGEALPGATAPVHKESKYDTGNEKREKRKVNH